MTQRARNLIAELSTMIALGFALALVIPHANAEMIATDAAQQRDARSHVKAMVERPEIVQALRKMGIVPGDAAARVDAMNDAEVHQLASRIDALPAGGALGNQDFLFIIIVILLAVILL